MSAIERFCAQRLEDARRAVAARDPLAARLVVVLDAQIGAMYRLLAASADLAARLESDPDVAAIVRAHEGRMNVLLRTALHESGIHDDGVVALLLAAAIDALRTGDIADEAYRARLRPLVDALLLEVKPRRRR